MTQIRNGLRLVLLGVISVLARGPRHVATAQNVQVQVVNSLATVRAGVDDDAVPAGKVLRCRGVAAA